MKSVNFKLGGPTVETIFYRQLRCPLSKLGGLDLSRRDLDRDLDLDAQKVSVSTVEKISTVFKS